MPSRSAAIRPAAATLLAAAVLTASACSSGGSPGRPPGGASTAAAGSTSPATGPAATATQPSSAAGTASRVGVWVASTRPLFAAVQTDTEQIAAAAGKQDVAALPALCTQLASDVARVQSAPAAPDKRIASAVGSAMQDYAAAAHSCQTGDYGGAAQGINQGAAALEQANALMQTMS